MKVQLESWLSRDINPGSLGNSQCIIVSKMFGVAESSSQSVRSQQARVHYNKHVNVNPQTHGN